MLIDRDTDSSSQVYHRRFNSDPGSRRLSERRGHIFNVSPRHTPSPDSSTQTNCMFSHFFTGCSTSSTCLPPSSHGTTPSPNTSTLSLPLSTPRSSIDRLPHSLSFSGRAKALDIPHPFMPLLHCASSSSDINAECNDFTVSTATALPSDSLGSKHSRRPPTDFASLACSTYSYPLADNDEDSNPDIEFAHATTHDRKAMTRPPTLSNNVIIASSRSLDIRSALVSRGRWSSGVGVRVGLRMMAHSVV